MVITATPSAPTSSVVLPLFLLPIITLCLSYNLLLTFFIYQNLESNNGYWLIIKTIKGVGWGRQFHLRPCRVRRRRRELHLEKRVYGKPKLGRFTRLLLQMFELLRWSQSCMVEFQRLLVPIHGRLHPTIFVCTSTLVIYIY